MNRTWFTNSHLVNGRAQFHTNQGTVRMGRDKWDKLLCKQDSRVAILTDGYSVWCFMQIVSAQGTGRKWRHHLSNKWTHGAYGDQDSVQMQVQGQKVILVAHRVQPRDWLGTSGDVRQKPGLFRRLSSNPVSIFGWVDSLALAKTVVAIDFCVLNGTPVLQGSFALNFYEF